MNPFIIDTETAGMGHGVCDLAYMRIDENLNVIEEVESLIDPERPISPSASGIHHITDDMVYAEPTLAEFMHMRNDPFKVEGAIFIGHNVGYDTRVIGPTHLPESYRSLDTLKLARNMWPDAEDHKLQTLRYQFKLSAGTAHRAMGDVYTCLNLLRKIAGETNTDLHGLLELARKPLSLENKMPFGKHRGIKLKELPKSYCEWALAKLDDLDPDLKEALQTRLNG